MSISAPQVTSEPSNAAVSGLYSFSDKVPKSVLDVLPVDQSTGSPFVNAALDDISTFNAALWVSQNFDWSYVASRIGQAAADHGQLESQQAMEKFRSMVVYAASSAGVPVSTATDTSKAIVVSDTSFNSGGSKFSVTTEKNGAFSAMKDGKPWKSWDAPQSGGAGGVTTAASMALQILTAKKSFFSTTA